MFLPWVWYLSIISKSSLAWQTGQAMNFLHWDNNKAGYRNSRHGGVVIGQVLSHSQRQFVVCCLVITLPKTMNLSFLESCIHYPQSRSSSVCSNKRNLNGWGWGSNDESVPQVTTTEIDLVHLFLSFYLLTPYYVFLCQVSTEWIVVDYP